MGDQRDESIAQEVFSCRKCRTIVGDSLSLGPSLRNGDKTVTLLAATNVFVPCTIDEVDNVDHPFLCGNSACHAELGVYRVTSTDDKKFVFSNDALSVYVLGSCIVPQHQEASSGSEEAQMSSFFANPAWKGSFVSLENLRFDRGKPFAISTFTVYPGIVGDRDVIVKVIPIGSVDRLNYAREEVEHTFAARGYDNWKCVRSAGYSVDATLREVYIIASRNTGAVPTKAFLASDSFPSTKKDQWILDLVEGLACCHINNIFHQDVRNGEAHYTPNVMIDAAEPRTLRLIDLGDSVRPSNDEDAIAALVVDLEGLLGFGAMFGAGAFGTDVSAFMQDMEKVYSNIKQYVQTKMQCRLFLWNRAKDLRAFPAGVTTLAVTFSLNEDV